MDRAWQLAPGVAVRTSAGTPEAEALAEVFPGFEIAEMGAVPRLSTLDVDDGKLRVSLDGFALFTARREELAPALEIASLSIDHERARVEASNAGTVMESQGDTTIIETAAGGQYEDGPIRVDGAAGVAIPLGVGADPWPEAKLTSRWRPVQPIELSAAIARKGRTPSLRERYDSLSGNPALGPEIATLGEVRATVEPREGTTLEVSPYWRRSTGTVVGGADNRLVNLGTADVRGVDASARVRVVPQVEVGGSYQLTAARARSGDTDAWRDDPLDFLPRHRADAWLRLTPHTAVTLMGRVRHAGESIDRMNTVSASTLVDASASATLGGDWLAVVRLDDLLDERPEVRSNVRGPGRVLSLMIQGTWN